jgi:polysaccharide biosynthesis protein PslG
MKFENYPALKPIGRLRTVRSTEISSSKLGVGFETLDRDMWDANQAWPVLDALGVKWARVQTGWARCEKQPGVYDFAWLDDIVDKLLARGVTPWFGFSYGNPIHCSEGCPPHGVGFPPVTNPAQLAAWHDYVRALVVHFRDRVTHYEIWNEPDLLHFWRPMPKASEYTKLVAASASAIRSVQPDAKIIGGAIAWGMTPWSIKFLEDCFRCGLHEHIDIVSYHGYKSVPERHSTQEFPAFKHLLKKYKPSLLS